MDANPAGTPESRPIARRWRPLTPALGAVVAILFVLLADPFLRFLLDRPLPDITPAVLLFRVVVVTRFAALMQHVDTLRAGRQREEVLVLVSPQWCWPRPRSSRPAPTR